MAFSAAASSVRAASNAARRAGRASTLRLEVGSSWSTWACSDLNSSASWLARSDGTISAGGGLRMASTRYITYDDVNDVLPDIISVPKTLMRC